MLKLSTERVGEILTLQQAVVIADIVRAAQQKATVAWIDAEGDEPVYGTVRCIGDEWGNLLNAGRGTQDA